MQCNEKEKKQDHKEENIEDMLAAVVGGVNK